MLGPSRIVIQNAGMPAVNKDIGQVSIDGHCIIEQWRRTVHI